MLAVGFALIREKGDGNRVKRTLVSSLPVISGFVSICRRSFSNGGFINANLFLNFVTMLSNAFSIMLISNV